MVTSCKGLIFHTHPSGIEIGWIEHVMIEEKIILSKSSKGH